MCLHAAFCRSSKQCVPRYHCSYPGLTVCDMFQIFGEQISYGSPYDRPEVLDFPTYAACRFLDTSPNNPVSVHPCCRLTALHQMQLVMA